MHVTVGLPQMEKVAYEAIHSIASCRTCGKTVTELITQKKGKTKSEMLNMEEIHWKILRLMGEEYENIYL